MASWFESHILNVCACSFQLGSGSLHMFPTATTCIIESCIYIQCSLFWHSLCVLIFRTYHKTTTLINLDFSWVWSYAFLSAASTFNGAIRPLHQQIWADLRNPTFTRLSFEAHVSRAESLHEPLHGSSLPGALNRCRVAGDRPRYVVVSLHSGWSAGIGRLTHRRSSLTHLQSRRRSLIGRLATFVAVTAVLINAVRKCRNVEMQKCINSEMHN